MNAKQNLGFTRRLGLKYICSHTQHPILFVPRANIYRFGDANKSLPVFQNLEWKIMEGESWAVVGSAGSEKSMLLQMLLGHMRLHPSPPSGLYPFLANSQPPRDPHDCVSIVSFATRRAAGGGGFYDYTARYGAVREEDRITLRESLFPDSVSANADARVELDDLSDRLDLKHLLDLPLIALSNGQTRRARIVKELLKKPEVLLLDEPLTGLDDRHRPKLIRLLGEIHSSRKPRVIMALRPQDPLPEWISHIALVNGSRVKTGPRGTVNILPQAAGSKKPVDHNTKTDTKKISANELVSMKDVNVRYHNRHVLKSVNWTISEGDRWHLQGANGSGKTTLMSLLTGDHPQSYTQPHLILFSSPRRRQPTSSLQRLIGAVSPELYNAFPRRMGPNALTVRDAIATGFESTFTYRPRTRAMDARIDALLDELGPARWGGAHPHKFDSQPFAALSPGEQSLVLLLRALVNSPPLLILDEVFSGMDSRMVDVARTYLRDRLDEKQAVVFITHWKDEVPWDGHVVRTLRLEDGTATEVL